MCEKTAEKQKCWILEVTGDQSRFVKVDGEMVDIGEGVEAFVYNESAPDAPLAFWRVVDLMTGWKLSKPYALKEEAIRIVANRIQAVGIEVYKRSQKTKYLRFGRSPARLLEFEADGIEVIQEPGEREIKTCARE